MLMTGQLRRPGRWSVSIPLVCVGFLTLLAISLSRDKGKGGGAEAVNGCVSFMADMSLGLSVWSSCNVANGEGSNGVGAAAIEGAGLGIRRLRRDEDNLFVQVTPKFRKSRYTDRVSDGYWRAFDLGSDGTGLFI